MIEYTTYGAPVFPVAFLDGNEESSSTFSSADVTITYFDVSSTYGPDGDGNVNNINQGETGQTNDGISQSYNLSIGDSFISSVNGATDSNYNTFSLSYYATAIDNTAIHPFTEMNSSSYYGTYQSLSIQNVTYVTLFAVAGNTVSTTTSYTSSNYYSTYENTALSNVLLDNGTVFSTVTGTSASGTTLNGTSSGSSSGTFLLGLNFQTTASTTKSYQPYKTTTATTNTTAYTTSGSPVTLTSTGQTLTYTTFSSLPTSSFSRSTTVTTSTGAVTGAPPFATHTIFFAESEDTVSNKSPLTRLISGEVLWVPDSSIGSEYGLLSILASTASSVDVAPAVSTFSSSAALGIYSFSTFTLTFPSAATLTYATGSTTTATVSAPVVPYDDIVMTSTTAGSTVNTYVTSTQLAITSSTTGTSTVAPVTAQFVGDTTFVGYPGFTISWTGTAAVVSTAVSTMVTNQVGDAQKFGHSSISPISQTGTVVTTFATTMTYASGGPATLISPATTTALTTTVGGTTSTVDIGGGQSITYYTFEGQSGAEAAATTAYGYSSNVEIIGAPSQSPATYARPVAAAAFNPLGVSPTSGTRYQDFNLSFATLIGGFFTSWNSGTTTVNPESPQYTVTWSASPASTSTALNTDPFYISHANTFTLDGLAETVWLGELGRGEVFPFETATVTASTASTSTFPTTITTTTPTFTTTSINVLGSTTESVHGTYTVERDDVTYSYSIREYAPASCVLAGRKAVDTTITAVFDGTTFSSGVPTTVEIRASFNFSGTGGATGIEIGYPDASVAPMTAARWTRLVTYFPTVVAQPALSVNVIGGNPFIVNGSVSETYSQGATERTINSGTSVSYTTITESALLTTSAVGSASVIAENSASFYLAQSTSGTATGQATVSVLPLWYTSTD